MKTRIVKTKYWYDYKVDTLTKDALLLLIFLLTSPQINLIGAFEISDNQIISTIKLTKEELLLAKKELENAGLAKFHCGWIYIPNAIKHNPYHRNEKAESAFLSELEQCPKQFRDEIVTYLKSESEIRVLGEYLGSRPNTKYKNPKTKDLSEQIADEVMEALT